jgi:hypothetical protein
MLHFLTLFVQSVFAGLLIGGHPEGLRLHNFTARVLVPLAAFQAGFAFTVRAKGGCPAWVAAASIGILLAEIAEFAAGHSHNVALHVPLGVAIFGGVVRQFLWAVAQSSTAHEQ